MMPTESYHLNRWLEAWLTELGFTCYSDFLAWLTCLAQTNFPEPDPEEVAAITVERLVTSMRSAGQVTNHRGFVFQVLCNAARTLRRTSANQTSLPLIEDVSEDQRRTVTYLMDPLDMLLHAEQEAAEISAIASLPEKLWRVMSLKLDGFPTCEIASRLDIAERTVRKRLRKAKSKLQTD